MEGGRDKSREGKKEGEKNRGQDKGREGVGREKVTKLV